LSWRARIGVQIGAAVLVAVELAWRLVPFQGELIASLLVGMLVFVIVGYTNAFNFMDGINGIAGAQTLVCGLGTAGLAVVAGVPLDHPAVLFSLLAAGAAAGFLPHNFPRAKMFMGDVGSVPSGFLLAVLAAWVARDFGWWLLVPLGLLHANFLLDTGITLIRRVVLGDRWYEAHREHFYQRLVRAGKSHAFVTVVEMALQIIVLGLVLAYLQVGSVGRLLLIGIVVMIWLSFFTLAEVCFRRFMAEQD